MDFFCNFYQLKVDGEVEISIVEHTSLFLKLCETYEMLCESYEINCEDVACRLFTLTIEG